VVNVGVYDVWGIGLGVVFGVCSFLLEVLSCCVFVGLFGFERGVLFIWVWGMVGCWCCALGSECLLFV